MEVFEKYKFIGILLVVHCDFFPILLEVVMPVKFKHLDTGKTDTTESFFSDQFLKGRINSGQESNRGFDPIYNEGRDEEWRDQNWKEVKANELKYDEDVNHYITLTLADMVNPKSLAFANQYTVGIDADVGQIAVSLEETFKKYFLYKINADFLLFNLGLFNPDTNILGKTYFDKGSAHRHNIYIVRDSYYTMWKKKII